MRVREEEFAHEQRKLTLKVKEAEKRLEIMKINNEERMNLALDAKDKDKHRLVDQLESAKLEYQIELSKLDQKIADLSSEVQSKDKYIESLKASSQQQQGMLQQHIDKLKEVLAQKTDLASQMDHTNRVQQDQINEFKQTISSLEIKIANAVSQNQFEHEQMQRDRHDL